MVSTKLITIREAAEPVRAQGKHDQEIHPETADRLCEAVVRAVRIPIEELERILVCWPEAGDSSAGRCPMSRWKEFRREPVAGEWTRKQKRGYHRVRSLLWFWECHQFQVLWVTLHGRRRGCREADLPPQATASTDRTPARVSGLGVLPGPDGRRAWRPPYLLGLAGAGWGTRSAVLDLAGMALVAMASPPWGSGRLDQGLSAQPSFSEPSESLRHQPVCPGSMRLREHVLVLEAVPRLSHQPAVGRDAAPMVYQERLSSDQGRDRNPSHRLHQDLGGSALRASHLV
jgi:hypothetical protein